MKRVRGSLASRIALLATSVAVITALVAGSLAVGLIRQANRRAARQTLSAIADEAQTVAREPSARNRLALRALKVSIGLIGADGTVSSPNAIARNALTSAQIRAVIGGAKVSSTREISGRSVLVEARPTTAGGIVVAEARSDAVAVGEQAIRRLIIALAVAVVLAVVLGLFVAWRLSRPLKRTAEAAHALAVGRRDVALVPEGPAEVAAVAEALNVLAANLSASERRQRDFLLSVSHDLRTPLTAISGFAESMADGLVEADQVGRVGGVMLAESQRLGRLVADLLDLARLDAQDFRIDIINVDLGQLVSSAGEVWTTRCQATGVRFELERTPGPLPVRTDPARLRQVLDGLFDNALRVTPAGAPIVLAARWEAGRVVAEVRDGGPGLADDDLAVAFEQSVLFERYRGVRRVGTGLGLAIVARLVDRLGGTVEAGHATEGGARFTVRLPA